MKYLFASDTDFNSGKLTGAQRRFMELMQYIASTEEVVFVGRYNAQIAETENVTLLPINITVSKKISKHWASALALTKALKKYHGELKYDYAISFDTIASICYRAIGIKHIISLFREDLIGYREALLASKMKIAYFRLQERIAVKVSDKIIVQCENDKKHLIERNERHCRKLSEKVFIQINNANASWMNTDCMERTADIKKITILFVGNFSDRRKGHFLLLPAAMRLLDEGYEFELLCAGGGKELEHWKNLCKQYSDIHFLGQINKMTQYLQSSDMMVVPSLIDSCPNTVLEGLNAGLAVYGANTGGIPDLLQNEDFLFEANEDALYAFLKNILDSKRYKSDATLQQARKASLSFNWGEKIVKIIKS